MITIIIRGGNAPPARAGGAEDAAVDLPVTLADVQAAAETIRGAVRETPTSHSATLSAITGAEVWLKFENLQFTGAFKERGRPQLPRHISRAEERARGVVAASAGNHAQGVAYHAHLLGIPATIVMPADTPFTKVVEHRAPRRRRRARRRATTRARSRARSGSRHENGATLVPAFDDPRVIAGQGTIGLEMLAQTAADPLDTIVVPVGGGGLIAGIAVAVKAMAPERAGRRRAGRGLHGHVARARPRRRRPTGGPTIAEGIAVAEPGRADARDRGRARRRHRRRVGATNRGGDRARRRDREDDRRRRGRGRARRAPRASRRRSAAERSAVVLSGGNIDARMLSSVLLRALARSGRLVRLQIELPDRPGVLAAVAEIVGGLRANIVDVEHRRDLPGVALKSVRLDLSVETRDRRPRRRDREGARGRRVPSSGRMRVAGEYCLGFQRWEDHSAQIRNPGHGRRCSRREWPHAGAVASPRHRPTHDDGRQRLVDDSVHRQRRPRSPRSTAAARART